MDLEKRVRMAAESILENESLREGLEDEAASALLDWGVERAKKIASETAHLEDETEAEEAMYPRMRALRQMLLAVTRLCRNSPTDELDQTAQDLPGLAALVYGPKTLLPTAADWQAFVAAQSGTIGQKLDALHAWIEQSPNTPQGE